MTNQFLLGAETEYAIGARGEDGEPYPQDKLIDRFLAHARSVLPYSSVADNRFLSNGGLLYKDQNRFCLHAEYATPECATPQDLVRYFRAGDHIVAKLAAGLSGEPGISDVFATRCNVDHIAKTVWGAHESFLARCDPRGLQQQFVPFLVSRVVISGAGGWDVRSPGLAFSLSPRSCFVTDVAAWDSELHRPIFDTFDETLSRTGTHRFHVSLGETLLSNVAALLKHATTMLVLAIVDRLEDTPGDAVQLVSPITALQRFSLDPTLRARAATEIGRPLTAVQIQRHYLLACERRLDSLPDWAESICQLWRNTLDDLENNPLGFGRRFDWAIKRDTYKAFLERHGVRWDSLPALNAVTRAFARKTVGLRHRADPLTPDAILSTRGAASTARAALAPLADRVGVTWNDVAALAAVRSKAFELDMKFGALVPEGVFDALDHAGVLDHHVAGVDRIEDAIKQPPAGTRAAVRGAVIARLSASRTRYLAEWMRIVDLDNGLELDLGDPFATEERWWPIAPQRRSLFDEVAELALGL